MSALDLGAVRMKAAATMSVGQARRTEGELAIRLKPIRRGEVPGIPVEHTWAWAVVYETRGDSQADGLLIGGSADSQTGALAMAEEALKEQDRRLAAGSPMTTPNILLAKG